MGFISNLFSGKRKQEDEAAKRAQERWAKHMETKSREPLEHIHLEGSRSVKIYVYDGKPLKGVKKGDVITLDAIGGVVFMESTLTGTLASNTDGWNTALGYKGQKIGFTSGACGVINELLERGHTVSISAHCNGMYAKGIPDLEAMLPPQKELNALVGSEQ